MPTECYVDVKVIDPPLKPMRRDTLMEGMGELINDIAQNGLINAVSIRDCQNGRFYIIAGHRRYLAHVEMGRLQVRCAVYAPGEGDDDQIRGSENFVRQDVNPVEEAEFYKDQMDKHNISVAEVARRYNRSPSHVQQSVALLDGNKDVLEALRAGTLTKAQAYEINKIHDELGQKTALHYAKNNGMTARSIKHYREGREMSGVDTGSERVMQVIQESGPPTSIITLLCSFCKNYKPMEHVMVLQGCSDCMSELTRAAEFYNPWDAALRDGRVDVLPAPPQPRENNGDG